MSAPAPSSASISSRFAWETARQQQRRIERQVAPRLVQALAQRRDGLQQAPSFGGVAAADGVAEGSMRIAHGCFATAPSMSRYSIGAIFAAASGASIDLRSPTMTIASRSMSTYFFATRATSSFVTAATALVYCW